MGQSIYVDGEAFCSECSEELGIDDFALDGHDSVRMDVVPCEACIQSAISEELDREGSEAFQLGQQEGEMVITYMHKKYLKQWSGRTDEEVEKILRGHYFDE